VATLYANENFPLPVVDELRRLGHDVLTIQETGKAGQRTTDEEVLEFAIADARDLDWMLHANPKLKEKGLLVVFNPLAQPLERTLRVNVYYTGLSDQAQVSEEGGPAKTFFIGRDYTIELPIQVPPQTMKWFVLDHGAPEIE
jgi:hypothetical protein